MAVPLWYDDLLLHLSRLRSTHPQGILAGFDQKSNVVLSDSKERVYSMDEGVEEIPLGLYLVKGDMMYVCPRYGATAHTSHTFIPARSSEK